MRRRQSNLPEQLKYLEQYTLYSIGIWIRDGHGPGGPRAGAGRAGPENPGPRAVRAETGLKFFIE